MRIDRNNPIPLHHQLREIVTRQIQEGTWAAHQAIATEAELMERYGVSRSTVRQALAALVADGLLYRQQGKGTFVAPARIAQALDRLTGFAEVLLNQGLHPQIQLLTVDWLPAGNEVAQELKIDAESQILFIERRIDVKGEPLFLDRSHLPTQVAELLSLDHLASKPVLQWLEEGGFPLIAARLNMTARLATAEEASVLHLQDGAPILLVRRLVEGSDAAPVLYSSVICRADRYQVEIRLNRAARVQSATAGGMAVV